MQQRLAVRPKRHRITVSVKVYRADGSCVPGRITLLWYDGCEVDIEERLEVGEMINIDVPRMGFIRAHVLSAGAQTTVVKFSRHCPV